MGVQLQICITFNFLSPFNAKEFINATVIKYIDPVEYLPITQIDSNTFKVTKYCVCRKIHYTKIQ